MRRVQEWGWAGQGLVDEQGLGGLPGRRRCVVELSVGEAGGRRAGCLIGFIADMGLLVMAGDAVGVRAATHICVAIRVCIRV